MRLQILLLVFFYFCIAKFVLIKSFVLRLLFSMLFYFMYASGLLARWLHRATVTNITFLWINKINLIQIGETC